LESYRIQNFAQPAGKSDEANENPASPSSTTFRWRPIVLRDREEQRWTASETVLALPWAATVKVEVLDEVQLIPVV
jgi:hypothetical protein